MMRSFSCFLCLAGVDSLLSIACVDKNRRSELQGLRVLL